MLDVNLSRIHNMIRNINNSIRQLQSDIAASKGLFTLNILRATTDADLEEFRKRLASRKKTILKKKGELELRLDYLSYLKDVLDRENGRHGITEKLRQLAAAERMRDELERYRNAVLPLCAEEWEFERSADYYKSSFTEEKTIYALSAHLFNADYPGELLRERDRLEKRRQVLDDELASLNQTVTVSINSLEEFAASRPKNGQD